MKKIITELVGLVSSIIDCLIYSLIGLLLWNYCLITVFPIIPKITFLQFMGIFILSNILFKPKSINIENKD